MYGLKQAVSAVRPFSRCSRLRASRLRASCDENDEMHVIESARLRAPPTKAMVRCEAIISVACYVPIPVLQLKRAGSGGSTASG
jgi:hypothetical protein